MTVQTLTVQKDADHHEDTGLAWANLSKLGAAAALLTVLTALIEILITFLPGGYNSAETVKDWFALLQSNPFLGLRNLGLINILLTALGVPLVFSIYAVHRKTDHALAALAMIISFIGVAVFYASNQALPMLNLSAQYAAATTDGQKAMLEAAGQAMLSVGQSHTPGTFLAFFFAEVAGILLSVLMLRGKLFGLVTSLAGLIGYGFLLIYEVLVSFVPSSHNAALLLAMVGGLSNILWSLLVAIRLFQLGQSHESLKKLN